MAIGLGTFHRTRKSRAGVKAKDSKRAKQNGMRTGLASFRKTPRRKTMMTASAILGNLSLSMGILLLFFIISKTDEKENPVHPSATPEGLRLYFDLWDRGKQIAESGLYGVINRSIK